VTGLPPVTGFFFDNNVSPHLSTALKSFGEPVCHIREIWEKDPGDPVWLPEIGKRGLVLVTFDLGITKKPHEIALFHKHNVGGIFLRSKDKGRGDSIWDQVEALVHQWTHIKRTADAEPRPFVFALGRQTRKLVRLLR
jgi:hypothetical protein